MVRSSDTFLIDANALITPYRFYYAFDLAPSFWEKLANEFKNNRIVLLDKVKDELLKGEDDLTNWIKENEEIINVCNYKTESVIANYQSVLQYIQTSGLYKESALAAWVPANIADPWLIAAAKANGYTVVTLEAPSGGLSTKTPNKEAKIPDVAKALGVKTSSLFEMMRTLGIVL